MRSERHKLHFEKANIETIFSLDRLKGWVTRRLSQATGQLTSTCTAPTDDDVERFLIGRQHRRSRLPRVVAVQVAFERQTLKPVFHLIGYRLWV
jgi:hypothetical protein